MSRARTRRARIEERTLSIGFGIKRASQGEIGLPELLALQPALDRRERIPLGPFLTDQVFRLDHAKLITAARLCVNLGALFTFPPEEIRQSGQAKANRLQIGGPDHTPWLVNRKGSVRKNSGRRMKRRAKMSCSNPVTSDHEAELPSNAMSCPLPLS